MSKELLKALVDVLDDLKLRKNLSEDDALNISDSVLVRAEKAIENYLTQPEKEPVAWKVNLIDHFQSLYDTEMLRTDEGEYLILLEDAICAVEEWSPSKPERMTDDEISAVTAGHDPTPYGVHMFKMGIRWYEKYKSRVGVYDDSE